MELRLTLSAPERLLDGRTEARLREGELTIGRSAEAGWPIPDPERVISKVHCRIAKEPDGFQLTDLSTNGVKINDIAVGYGLARRIEDGDVIKLGDAVLAARIVDAAPASPFSETLADVPAVDIAADGPFGPAQAESSFTEARPGEQRPVASVAKGVVLDDWWGPSDESAPAAAVNPVDIFPQPVSAAIEDIHSAEETVMSEDRGVASLLRMAVGLDVEMLARAVEEAAAVLSAGERNKFKDRLSEIIRNASLR